MALELITDSQLEELCFYMTQQEYIYYPDTKLFMTDLYNTGCRPMELLEYSRWNYISDADIELTVEKQETIRHFTSSDLTPNLLFAIQNQIEPYGSLTLRQLTWVMKKLLPVPRIQTGFKSAITYMFRYNYVKKLHNAGMSDADIRTIMSWTALFDPGIYYNQDLYSWGELPPLATYYIIDDAGNILIDDVGNYIVSQ